MPVPVDFLLSAPHLHPLIRPASVVLETHIRRWVRVFHNDEVICAGLGGVPDTDLVDVPLWVSEEELLAPPDEVSVAAIVLAAEHLRALGCEGPGF